MPRRGAVTLTYLVADQAQDEFISAAHEGIAELERLGCAATLRGPLPAYSFADVRLKAGCDE
jgi:Gas vesicle synthesis protein GvpL/GvpF